jgi:hypothetical protein
MQVTPQPPLDRLLGGRPDRLGIKEKEAILDAVLRGTNPRKSRYFPWIYAFATAALVLAVSVQLLRPESPGELTPKGGQTSAVELSCHPGSLTPCRVGDRLYFRGLSEAKGRYLAAFAKTTAGNVVWFFPSDEASVTPALSDGFLDEASMLPAELTENVTVHIVLSETPLTRSQIRAIYDDGATTAVRKLERSLRIER